MSPPSKRDIQAENRRNQLLDIALALFAEKGVENVSIKEIATKAGIAQGLIYHYFQSKGQLLTAVIQRDNPMPDFEAINAQLAGLPARDGLNILARRLSELMPKKRLVLRLLMRELLSSQSGISPMVASFRKKALRSLTEYFQSRIKEGELRSHDPSVSVQMLVSTLLAQLFLNQPLEPASKEAASIILNGILAR